MIFPEGSIAAALCHSLQNMPDSKMSDSVDKLGTYMEPKSFLAVWLVAYSNNGALEAIDL
jgi:hypothetical protein